MQPLFETLESRSMFSAAPMFIPHVSAVAPRVHMTAPLKNTAVTVLHFVGTVTNSANQSTGLTLDLTAKSCGGYTGTAVHTNSAGTTDKYSVTFDAKGRMVLNNTEPSSNLHVEAQLSTNGKTITGTFTSNHVERGATYTDQGKVSATLSNPTPSPSPSPKPSPTPVPSTGHYVGTAAGADGTNGTLTVDIVATTDGSRFGTVKHFNKTGVLDTTFTVKFDSTGKFTYTGSDNSSAPQAGSTIVAGQMSSDGKTIIGSFKVTNGDGNVSTGTFSLSLVTTTTTKK